MLWISVPGTPAVRGDDCLPEGGKRRVTERKRLARSHCAVSGRLPSFTPSFIVLVPSAPPLPSPSHHFLLYFKINFLANIPTVWLSICRNFLFLLSLPLSLIKNVKLQQRQNFFFSLLPPLALHSLITRSEICHERRIAAASDSTSKWFFIVPKLFFFFVVFCHLLPADRSSCCACAKVSATEWLTEWLTMLER